jgi:aminoglycoside phosphotransferase
VTIEAALANLGRERRRARYAYETSWPLEEIELERPDGSRLHVLLKRLDGTPASKPEYAIDRAREIEAYSLLEDRNLGTPRCYAAGRWWLAIEKVPGVELWQRGDLGSWEAASAWAGSLHRAFADAPPESASLLRRDECFHRMVLDRAATRGGAEVERLRPAAENAIARLAQLPRTLIHGELYPSNILIADGRVAVVDWEMAGIGAGVIDLAAIVTGWDPADRDKLVDAYGTAARSDVAAARLILALQWIGWNEGWQPPAEHRRDWLAEARDAAEAFE